VEQEGAMPTTSSSISAMSKSLTSAAICATAGLLLSGCASTAQAPEGYVDQVGVQLFMYNWNSVAAECEYLGEVGVDWVLVAPPQEHII
jgi:alpha-amylase